MGHVVKVSFEEQVACLTVDPVTTVEMLISLVGRAVGVPLSCATHGLFRDSLEGHRRTTVRVDMLEEKETVAALNLGEDEVLVCRPCVGKSVLRVLITFADRAVETPMFGSLSSGEFAKLVLDKAGLKVVAPVLLVKFKPYDASDARHDDWEVLSAARSLSSYSFAGYSILLCLEDEFQKTEGAVRVWLNLLLDWERHKKLLKSRLRSGVPGWARGQIWALLLEAPSQRAEHPGLFASLVAEAPADAKEGLSERWESDRRVIFRDVFRTFPTHPYFRLEQQTGQLALQHVLVAWHSMEPSTGYCQVICKKTFFFVFFFFLLFLHSRESTLLQLYFYCIKRKKSLFGLCILC